MGLLSNEIHGDYIDMNISLSEKKKYLKILVIQIISLIPFAVIGTALMCFSYMLPVNEVYKENAQAILDEQNTSADYPLIHSWEQYFTSFRPGVFDGGSTTIIIGNSYNEVNGNYLKEAMMPHYARYWHGYVVLWRPLLYLIEYKDLEILMSYILFGLAMAITAVIYKKKSALHAVFFSAYFFLTMPMIVGMCLQYTPVALITYGSILIYIYKLNRLSQNEYAFCIFFTVIGILTCYLDLLTYPLVTWGLVVIWAIIMDPAAKKPTEYLVMVISSGLSWIIGYGGMWISKTVIASIVLDKNVLMDALNESVVWSGTSNVSWLRFASLFINWKHYAYPVYAAILLACFTFWFIQGITKGWKYSEKKYALGLVMLSSPVWYLFLCTHTYVHHLFTYRIYGVMIMAGLGIMAETMPDKRNKAMLPGIKKIIPIITCGFAALIGTCITYEETEISNKECSYPKCIEYTDDSIKMEMNFYPAQNRICGICIAVYSNSTTGEYVLRLNDSDGELYEEHFDIAGREYNYKIDKVDWKVKKGNEYKLTIESIGNDMPVSYYTFEGDGTIDEIGPAIVNGTENGGEELFGVVYWFRPYSKLLKIFIFLSWFSVAVIMSVVLKRSNKSFG